DRGGQRLALFVAPDDRRADVEVLVFMAVPGRRRPQPVGGEGAEGAFAVVVPGDEDPLAVRPDPLVVDAVAGGDDDALAGREPRGAGAAAVADPGAFGDEDRAVDAVFGRGRVGDRFRGRGQGRVE